MHHGRCRSAYERTDGQTKGQVENIMHHGRCRSANERTDGRTKGQVENIVHPAGVDRRMNGQTDKGTGREHYASWPV